MATTPGSYQGASTSGQAATSSTPAYQYDAAADAKIVPGSKGKPVQVGGFGGNDGPSITGLAQSLGIKSLADTDLESEIIKALAEKYGVPLETPGSIDVKKVGTRVTRKGGNLRGGGPSGRTSDEPGVITSEGSIDEPTSTPPGKNPKALAEIAKKVGAKGNTLQDIAAAVEGGGGGGTQPVSIDIPGGQTVGQERTNFYNQLTKNPKGKNVQAIVSGLEQAGYLSTDINGAAPNTHDITHAFNQALTDATNNNVDPATQIQNKIAEVATPAAGQSTSEAAAYVQGIADEFGVNLSPQDITAITNKYDTSQGGVSNEADQIKADIVSRFDPSTVATAGGVAGLVYQGIKTEAQALQIPISDAAIGGLVKSGLAGASVASILQDKDMIVAQAEETLKEQAKGLYPTLAAQIDAGYKVTDITQPYNQIAAQYLGVDPNSIQTNDPSGKWSKFLQGGKDEKTGAPTMMTMDQWKKTIMQDPSYGFQKTQGAQDMAGQFAASIVNAFGAANSGAGTTFSQYTGTPGSANT